MMKIILNHNTKSKLWQKSENAAFEVACHGPLFDRITSAMKRIGFHALPEHDCERIDKSFIRSRFSINLRRLSLQRQGISD
jgi:sporulation-control protein spo0M